MLRLFHTKSTPLCRYVRKARDPPMRSMKWFAAAAGVLSAALAGCGNEGPAPEVKPPSPQVQIESIRNNPNMPPGAKDAAIAALQRNVPGSSGAAPGSGK